MTGRRAFEFHDTGGRRTAKTITGSGTIARSETYGYDVIDQVTSSNYGASGTESFAYDAMGNRSSANLLGQGSLSYTANNLNQYTAINTAAPTYDASGNTLSVSVPTSSSTSIFNFNYDGQSRLTSATVGFPGLPGYHAATFVYDARNRQVSRTVDGVTTYFIWDGWSLLAEYQVTGGTPAQTARYVHGPRLDEILVQSRGVAPSLAYLHEDALGSTYLLTDASGAMVERYAYTVYGKVTAFDNTGAAVAASTTRFLYTGRERIAELGLNDHRNRFYLPSLGRWLNRDPIGENGGVNLYCYVLNASANWIDLLGLAVDLNMFPPDEKIYDFARKYPDAPDDTYVVGAHGNSGGVLNSKYKAVDYKSLAKKIKASKKWKKGKVKKVKLESCNVGDGDYADNLAKELGVPVDSVTDVVDYYPDGSTTTNGMTRTSEP